MADGQGDWNEGSCGPVHNKELSRTEQGIYVPEVCSCRLFLKSRAYVLYKFYCPVFYRVTATPDFQRPWPIPDAHGQAQVKGRESFHALYFAESSLVGGSGMA
jgi:hypothetical protein